jgi:MFS family permease
VVAVALPYLLRSHGITVEHIASIGALVQAPSIWYLLWAPVVDVRFRRRTWVMALAVASAVCAALAIGRNTAAIGSLTAFLVASSVFNQPISSALGGLVASVVPDDQRGRTGGWSQAGIVGGGVIAGGLAVWLADNASPAITALVVGVLIAAPAFAVLAIDEPSSPRTELRSHLASMRRSITTMLKQREVWLGLVFFLSPIGAGALMNLFSAVAIDFHASSNMVVLVVALAGIVMPLGALVGGSICDRFDRWRVYPVAGILAALSACAMLFAPPSPLTYVAGAAGYAFTIGICYAAFMSLAFQLVGSASAASGTRFTLFMAAVNVPVVYMLRLDGIGHQRWGVRGMLAVDAMSNGLFGILFLVIVWIMRSRYARRSTSARWAG